VRRESQISEFSAEELAAFREWFAEFDASAWDRQFEAESNHAAGRSSEL